MRVGALGADLMLECNPHGSLDVHSSISEGTGGEILGEAEGVGG